MCSRSEDNVSTDVMTPVANVPRQGAVCRRCLTTKASVLLRKTDPYCSACFMRYAVHKFRATVGKARAIKPNECVLLAYSGGLSSGAMVKLVSKGLQDFGDQKVRLVYKPTLLHVDEGGLLNLPEEERLRNFSSILEFAKECNFDLYTCKIEFGLASDPHDLRLHHNSYTIEPSIYDDQFKRLFDSVGNLTAKEDLLLRFKQRVITLSANRLDHQKVLLGATATRLASQLLAAVGQGRGAQIADEIGFSDCRSGIEFLRPMREFVDKEVAYLAHFLLVRSVCIPTLSSKLGPTASIGRLTEEFIVKLQVDFPGTISTLFRIGDKLKSDNNRSEEDSLCLLCRSRIEDAPLCSAYSARVFSQTVSRSGPSASADSLFTNGDPPRPSSGCGEGSPHCGSSLKACCQEKGTAPPQKDWDTSLCYGCRVTVQDVDRLELMPAQIQEEVKQRVRRQKMRLSVEQFLL